MSWEARLSAGARAHRLEGSRREAALLDLLKLVDEAASSRLLASRDFEDHLVEGVVVDEGEAPLATVIERALMLARGLERGRVLGVLYAGDVEARIIVESGGRRIAVAVLDGGRQAGHNALRLFGRVRGEYQLVVHEG